MNWHHEVAVGEVSGLVVNSPSDSQLLNEIFGPASKITWLIHYCSIRNF